MARKTRYDKRRGKKATHVARPVSIIKALKCVRLETSKVDSELLSSEDGCSLRTSDSQP